MVIVPFPLNRRSHFVRRQAAWFAEQSSRGAEHNLFHQMNLQREVLLRKGVDAALVETEVRALELAIRAEAARMISFGGGAA